MDTAINLYHTFTAAGRAEKLGKQVVQVEEDHGLLGQLLTDLPKPKEKTDSLEGGEIDPTDSDIEDDQREKDDIDRQKVLDQEAQIREAKAEVRLLVSGIEDSSWIQTHILPFFLTRPQGPEMVKLEKKVARIRRDVLNTTARAVKLLALKQAAEKVSASPAVKGSLDEELKGDQSP